MQLIFFFCIVEKHDKCFVLITREEFTSADGTKFGWKATLDLYSRECQRRDKGCARMVPKLKEVHVLRDAWTKLNVLPAKIMQVHIK